MHSYRPLPSATATTGPRLPARRRAPPASAPRVTGGRLAGVLIGAARVRKAFGGELFAGTVTSYQSPFFRVRYTDGDEEDLTGTELASILDYTEADLRDPRGWHYDYNVLNPIGIPGFVKGIREYCTEYNVVLPEVWLQMAKRSSPTWRPDHEDEIFAAEDYEINVEAYREQERQFLERVLQGNLSQARAPRTMANLQYPAIKMIHYAASRGLKLPLAPTELALYLAFLSKERNTVGAVTMAKNAASTIGSLNGHAAGVYDTAKVNATIETVKRRNRRQVKKAAGLTPNMISAIIRKYGYPRQGRRPEHQWEMAIGVAVAVGFKILLRYDDLVRARWNDGYCEVLETHVRFYLDGRKNNQYGGNFLDIAKPEKGKGIYDLVVAAKDLFRSGLVLPNINVATGVLHPEQPMSHSSFVAFLRSALINIGLSEEEAEVFSAHSMRAGGATAAAVHGLHQEDIQHLAGVKDANWLAWYNRHYLGERLRVSRAIGL